MQRRGGRKEHVRFVEPPRVQPLTSCVNPRELSYVSVTLQVLGCCFEADTGVVTCGEGHVLFWKREGQYLVKKKGVFGRKGKAQTLVCCARLQKKVARLSFFSISLGTEALDLWLHTHSLKYEHRVVRDKQAILKLHFVALGSRKLYRTGMAQVVQ